MHIGYTQIDLANDDVALLNRLQENGLLETQEFRRADLMRLMMLSGLSETRSYLSVALNQRDTFSISADVVRSMIRLAHIGHQDTARPISRPSRGRHKKKPVGNQIIEERIVENTDGSLRWEVRLTTRGLEERAKLTAHLHNDLPN